MPARIRLQRHGKKRKPFYYIVVADGRSKRDGRFIERLGLYNPNTNPATIELDGDKALDWMSKGAQPSDTVRAILRYEGVLYKKHLKRGVQKGAMSDEQAEQLWSDWKSEKLAAIRNKTTELQKEKDDDKTARLKEETKISQTRLANRKSTLNDDEAAPAPESVEGEVEEAKEPGGIEEVAEALGMEMKDSPAKDDATEETSEEAATEEAPAETEEAPAETATEEAPVEAAAEEEAATEEPAAEEATAEDAAAEESPAEETSEEEAPAEEAEETKEEEK